MLVFYWAETPLEDVEKVCGIVKLFIGTGQVAVNKYFYIPLNKKLRKSELKQFVINKKVQRERLSRWRLFPSNRILRIVQCQKGKYCQELLRTA